MKYDLHLHTSLSPCADDAMTPATVAGFSKLNGAELIAVTDHNSALNLPAAAAACAEYGLRLLPGIEVNTAEEIHLLAYFPTVEAALEMGRRLYEHLPAFPYDSAIWGNQLVMDEADNVTGTVDRLLNGAVTLDLYQCKAMCESLGGIAVPAHIDRASTSLLSVLGFAPPDLPFAAYEVSRPEHTLEKILAEGKLPPGQEILTSSDAHALETLPTVFRDLPLNSCLRRLLG